MFGICNIRARWILDSRGVPTVECDVIAEDRGGERFLGRASVPSGASTGSHEAIELRDGGTRFKGKFVSRAVANIKDIERKLIGMNVEEQAEIDKLLIKLDGTENKSNLGGNAILAVSMACLKAAASCRRRPLFKQIDSGAYLLPRPMLNVLNGGLHAGNGLAIQEFMIIPREKSFSDALESGVDVYGFLKVFLEKKYGRSARNVGDEGGFAPNISSTHEALDALVKSIEESGRKVSIGIDAAASSFYTKGKGKNNGASGTYSVDGKTLKSGELTDFYLDLIKTYPIISIEDAFFEEDFDAFAELTRKVSKKVQIVSDDLTVSNPERIKVGLENESMTALLLKVNQIGTVTEAIRAARIMQHMSMAVVVSHRSGETEDSFIADFAVGIGAGQIKTGAPARGERTAKYNQLLRIEEELGKKAKYFEQ